MSGARKHVKGHYSLQPTVDLPSHPGFRNFVAAGDMDVFAAIRTERRNSWRQ